MSVKVFIGNTSEYLPEVSQQNEIIQLLREHSGGIKGLVS
jgi:hypothetical protein